MLYLEENDNNQQATVADVISQKNKEEKFLR
jgi:hypothetical protein